MSSISLPFGIGGKLLNFASTRITTQAIQSLAADTQTPLFGLNIDYTPVSATSKLLISVCTGGFITIDNSIEFFSIRIGLFRDGLPIGNIPIINKFFDLPASPLEMNADNATRTFKSNFEYVDDSLNTSLRNYAITGYNINGATTYVNGDSFVPFITTISIQEIAL